MEKNKLSKLVKNDPFLTAFDSFWLLLIIFFLKHSDSVWQTYFVLNTVTQYDKHVFNTDLFLAVNLFSEKIR